MSVYDTAIQQLNGSDLDWNSFRGKKILIVNVASECGLTPQYKQLQELQETFGPEKFTVLGVPSNDFGGQEPGSSEQIAAFCTKEFGVTFPMTEKIMVSGDEMHPLYQYLVKQTNHPVTWNFQKFLVNEEGVVEGVLSPEASPFDEQVITWLSDPFYEN
jgi:glutathione peroxidase